MKKFTITQQHLDLLAAARTSVEDGHHGATFPVISIDDKRPYGNSSVHSDIGEILGMKKADARSSAPWWTAAQCQKMERLHRELATVLQICLQMRKFEAGEYQSEPYTNNWKEAPC